MTPPMRELARLGNLGPRSGQWLPVIGIRDEGALRKLRAVDAYRLLVLRGYRPSRVPSATSTGPASPPA